MVIGDVMTEYFVGRICTVLTKINNNFETQVAIEYFTGIVESIDKNYVVMKQVNSDRRSLFMAQNIVALVEEEVVEDEETIKMLTQHAKALPAMEPTAKVDIEQLEELNRQILDKLGK